MSKTRTTTAARRSTRRASSRSEAFGKSEAPVAAGVTSTAEMEADLQTKAIELAKQMAAINMSLPPGERRTAADVGRIVLSVVEMQRSLLLSVSRTLQASDRAYRENREYQRQMRGDPDVMGPLQRLQYGVSLLDFNIEPENAKDNTQEKQSTELKTIIERHMPAWIDYTRHLMEAPFYGPSMVNHVYRRIRTQFGPRIAPVEWLPIHPDTLEFSAEGAVGIKVGVKFGGDTVPGLQSRVHLLTPEERASCTLHVYHREGADFNEPADARAAYAGRGMRDIIWEFWTMKQTILQAWMTWCERYATGLRVGYYPQGHKGAKSAMESALRNWVGDASVTIPRISDGKTGTPDYELDLLEANGTGAVAFLQAIEYLSNKIKLMIEGQTATTEATSTGLGSSVADQHAVTFNAIVKWNAKLLAESLTRDLIVPMHCLNYGETDYLPRLTFALREVDPKEHMEAVEKFVNLGGTAPMSHTRDIIGIPEPEAGEPLLQMQMMGMGGGFGDDGAGDAGNPNKMKQAAQAFARALRA